MQIQRNQLGFKGFVEFQAYYKDSGKTHSKIVNTDNLTLQGVSDSNDRKEIGTRVYEYVVDSKFVNKSQCERGSLPMSLGGYKVEGLKLLAYFQSKSPAEVANDLGMGKPRQISLDYQSYIA